MDDPSAEAYVGLYHRTDGAAIVVAPWDLQRGEDALAFLDLATGRLGLLRPNGPTTFVAGPSLLVDEPVEITLTFERDPSGDIRGLVWQGATFATKRHVQHEPLAVAASGATLHGKLLLPDAPAPHPALVIVHGSGPGRRQTFGPLPYFFASFGLAVLAYDKRGSGDSSGDWRQAGYDDLADDVVAVLRQLTERPEIDPTRIGLLGSSEGGWVAPLATTRQPDVAFLLLLCAPGVTPAEQILHENATRLRAQDFAEDAVVRGVALVAQRHAVARTGRGWDELDEAVAVARSEPWFASIDAPRSRDSWAWGLLRRILDHDPLPALRQVRCPVLALFGARDPHIPVEASIAAMTAAFAEAGNSDVTFRIFPTGYHSLLEAEPGADIASPDFKRLVPGLLETVRTWLEARLQRSP